MASVLETTAVSFRKGSHAANEVFTGVSGEIVVDLGNASSTASGTDINATIRMHNGITPGGIPMARADMRNITTRVLAEYREIFGDSNLAYADLHNIVTTTDAIQIKRIVDVLNTYGIINTKTLSEALEPYAFKDTTNINTTDLTDASKHNSVDTGYPLAFASMKNVDTENLATGEGANGKHKGKNLAYADCSNIIIANLADKSLRPNDALAYANLSNVLIEDLYFKGVEILSNKYSGDIGAEASGGELPYTQDSYPTVQSVKDYVDTATSQLPNFLNSDLSNMLGMSSEEALAAKNKPWKVTGNAPIPMSLFSNMTTELDENTIYNLTTQAQLISTMQKFIPLQNSCGWGYKTANVISGAVTLLPYVKDYIIKTGTISAISFVTSHSESTTTTGNLYCYTNETSVYTDQQEPSIGLPLFDSSYEELSDLYISEVVYDDNMECVSITGSNGVVYMRNSSQDTTYTETTTTTYNIFNPGNLIWPYTNSYPLTIFEFNLIIEPNADCEDAVWPNSVVWLDDNEPNLITGQYHEITFKTLDAGTTWLGYAKNNTSIWG